MSVQTDYPGQMRALIRDDSEFCSSVLVATRPSTGPHRQVLWLMNELRILLPLTPGTISRAQVDMTSAVEVGLIPATRFSTRAPDEVLLHEVAEQILLDRAPLWLRTQVLSRPEPALDSKIAAFSSQAACHAGL